VTLLTCVMLALDSPVVADNDTITGLIKDFNYVVTAGFLIEIILKSAAAGLWGNEAAYLKNGWNALEYGASPPLRRPLPLLALTSLCALCLLPCCSFFIGLMMIMSLPEQSASTYKFIRAVRALRALRPLRLIMRYQSMRAVLMSLWNGLPDIFNVTI